MQAHALLRRQVGNDLVDVHIGLGAAAGLPDHQGELLVPLPRPDLTAGLGDGAGLGLGELAAAGVGPGAGLLQVGKGGDDLSGLALAADAEILQAALGLGTPMVVRRDGDFPHGVVFDAGIHDSFPHCSLRCSSLYRQVCPGASGTAIDTF